MVDKGERKKGERKGDDFSDANNFFVEECVRVVEIGHKGRVPTEHAIVVDRCAGVLNPGA